MNMKSKHEEKDLVALAISRLLAAVDKSDQGAALPRFSNQFYSDLVSFAVFRELLVSLHCALGGPLLLSALHLIDKEAVKVLVGRISGKKVVQVQVKTSLCLAISTLAFSTRATPASATTSFPPPTTAHARHINTLSSVGELLLANIFLRPGLPLGSKYIRYVLVL